MVNDIKNIEKVVSDNGFRSFVKNNINGSKKINRDIFSVLKKIILIVKRLFDSFILSALLQASQLAYSFSNYKKRQFSTK